MFGVPITLLVASLSCAATTMTALHGIWSKGKRRLQVVMTAVFAFVAFLFIGLAIYESRLAAAKEEAQISKLHRRINNVIAGNKMTLDQISESLISTPETEALKALDQLVDDGQVEADPPEPVYEVVGGVPRDCFQVQVFHHKDIKREIISKETSSDHDEGWIELTKITDFKKGDELKLLIGGTATKVLIQLLSVDHSPTEPYRMLGPFTVRDRTAPFDAAGTLSLKLTEDFPKTRRITVFGGKFPLNFRWLGDSNGPATLLSAQLLSG